MPSAEPFTALYKFVIIGSPYVGKTSLLNRATGQGFYEHHLATIGMDFKALNLDVDGKRVKIQIWDTAGQERFRCISRCYYKGANGIIITYDITSRSSFQEVENLIKELETNCGPEGLTAEKILIANKADMNHKREVSYDEGKQLADALGLEFLETSAKEALNVQEAFKMLARKVKVKMEQKAQQEQGRQEPVGNVNQGQRVELKDDSLVKKIFGSCCSAS